MDAAAQMTAGASMVSGAPVTAMPLMADNLPWPCDHCARRFRFGVGLRQHVAARHSSSSVFLASTALVAASVAPASTLATPDVDLGSSAPPVHVSDASVEAVAGTMTMDETVAIGGVNQPERGTIAAFMPRPVRPVGCVSAAIQAYYQSKGDLMRTGPLVPLNRQGGVSAFNSVELRKFRMFALATGGAGLSQTARVEYYDGVVAAERQTRLLNSATGRPPVLGPMESSFPSAAAFLRSLKSEQARCLSEMGWRVSDIELAGRSFKFYSRDLVDVAREALQMATNVVLNSRRRFSADGRRVLRTTALDSDIYQAEQADVFRKHRHCQQPVFTLAVQLFSDAALVSWNGGRFGEDVTERLHACGGRVRSVGDEFHWDGDVAPPLMDDVQMRERACSRTSMWALRLGNEDAASDDEPPPLEDRHASSERVVCATLRAQLASRY